MENKSRWFSWIIFEDEPNFADYVAQALNAGAEVYRHDDDFAHYHCLLYLAKPESKERAKAQLGRIFDSSFGIPKKPDATRRYIRSQGTKVTSLAMVSQEGAL